MTNDTRREACGEPVGKTITETVHHCTKPKGHDGHCQHLKPSPDPDNRRKAVEQLKNEADDWLDERFEMLPGAYEGLSAELAGFINRAAEAGAAHAASGETVSPGLDTGKGLPDGILAAYLRGWKDGRKNLDPKPTTRCEGLGVATRQALAEVRAWRERPYWTTPEAVDDLDAILAKTEGSSDGR